MYKIKLDPEIFEKFPDFNTIIVYADNINNVSSNQTSENKLSQVEQEQAKYFAENYPQLSAHPHIASWRKAYSAFGAKPKKYHCSAEALLKRVIKGDALPRINYLVDVYNALSMKYVVPFGGEDREGLSSDLVLKFATGEETFTVIRDGEEVNDPPAAGEVVYADSTGVTCRRWNWRQSNRTALTEKTKHAYFIIETLAPYDSEILNAAANDLIAEIKELNPEAEITIEHNPS